jgi:hypothetical protein
MSHTYEELKGKTVAELRDIASGIQHDALQGYSQLNKEHLLEKLCTALSIPMLSHHKVADVGVKVAAKGKIKTLKEKRDAAAQAGNHKALKHIRRRIHSLKRNLRKSAIVVAA